ncbi:hypothetical protein E2F50_22320 [Rhizobium deserti]|uniref:Uncharacterized protein n=1 Tax=Rhizobium deserti TaxID=2547961 RepID=A0A4R5U6C4_9HYPH|nr:hypothetical protein E2F50_22320 [Rhizobium deserti]
MPHPSEKTPMRRYRPTCPCSTTVLPPSPRSMPRLMPQPSRKAEPRWRRPILALPTTAQVPTSPSVTTRPT